MNSPDARGLAQYLYYLPRNFSELPLEALLHDPVIQSVMEGDDQARDVVVDLIVSGQGD